jgi:hypothetical protein
VPSPIAVSNILRRVSHNFHPQAPSFSFLQRVRPSRKQEEKTPWVLHQHVTIDPGMSLGKKEPLNRCCKGDMRESENLKIARWLQSRCGKKQNGGAMRHPGSARVRRLDMFTSTSLLIVCAFKGRCYTLARSFLEC